MCPTNEQGLRDELAAWKASNGFLFQDSCKTDIKLKSKFEAKCFKCGKIGHRAPECRVRFFNEKVGESGRSVEVTCYKCGVKGHKANECRSNGKKEQKESKGNRKEFKRKVSTVMLEGEYSSRMQRNALEGFLYGSNIIFTLDPGADISIVPIEVVPSIFKTGRVKKIRGYDNSVRAVETAEIEIDIVGYKLKREAGLLSFADLEGTAILSFDHFDRKNHDIYTDLMELRRSQDGCTIPIESGVVHCTKPEGSCKDSGGEKVMFNKETSDDSVHSDISEMFEESAEIKSESNSGNTDGCCSGESPCNMKEMSVEKGQDVVDKVSRQDEVDYCVLGSGDDVLAKAEVEGENLGGRAEYEEQELVKNWKLKNGLEVSELKKQTLLDESLETCRKLA